MMNLELIARRRRGARRSPRGRCVDRRRFGSILARAPLLWPRIVYDPRMRLYDSEFPAVASVTAAARRARDGETRHVRASETHTLQGTTRRNPLCLINSYLRGLY